MEIIHHSLPQTPNGKPLVRIPADRQTLAKRRWRGVAEDGREFGFDLDHALHAGAAVFATDGAVYVLEQKVEPVLEVALSSQAENAAKLGWLIGNLHFPLQIVHGAIRVVDDPAIRQMLEREHVPFAAAERVFQPISGGHSHSHDQGDDHHHRH